MVGTLLNCPDVVMVAILRQSSDNFFHKNTHAVTIDRTLKLDSNEKLYVLQAIMVSTAYMNTNC